MFNIPILLIIYKRPSNTQKVIEQLKKINPKIIFVSADGPKTDEDAAKCEATRALFDEKNWSEQTTIHKLFHQENLGVGVAPKTAVDWFFEHNEMGIILEDDIFPSLDFFTFCESILIRYKDNHRIMHVNAMNFHYGKKTAVPSYHFSKITCPWGWASWRRAWHLYDFNMSDLENHIHKLDVPSFYITEFINYKKVLLNHTSNAELFAWDYQWFYCVLKNQGIAVTPHFNLALNNGFNKTDASNTFSAPAWVEKIKLEKLPEIQHPETIELDEWADELTFKEIVGNYQPNYKKWFKHQIMSLFKK